jgi:hypothetical protein
MPGYKMPGWQIGAMAIGLNGKLAKWPIGETASWQNGMLG